MTGQPLLFNSWALYPCADFKSKNRRDALVSFLLKSLSCMFCCIGAKKTFFSRLLLKKLCCIMPQNSSESGFRQNYLEPNPICANRQWLLTCAALVFEINQIRHGKYPAKIFERRSIFHWKTIYRSVIIKVNLKSPQISHCCFVCVTKNAQANCQCVSSQFITSKMQETHSRGNTAVHYFPHCLGWNQKSGISTALPWHLKCKWLVH